VLLDGGLASHLHQGFTTQLSGNCGESLAPVTDVGRDLVELSLRPHGLVASWATFAEYLDVVDRQPLAPNVAFLVGHGTVRGAVLGAAARAPDRGELAAMVAELETALGAGALGLSSGLIYAPGMHAEPDEIHALVAATARHGALYATHMRNETGGLFDSLDESIAAVRSAGSGARLQVSHLKCGGGAVWGRAGDAIARLDDARRDGLDVGADQYPYTAAATTLATILPPALLALGVDECIDALQDAEVRADVRAEIARGRSGWENIAADPGWDGIAIAWAASHPEWAGRSIGELAADLGCEPADVAFDALVDDRLDVSIVIHCMDPADVATILAVPWIAVCTDAEGRRPGHPILDAGRPHPRTYGSTARVLGTYVRELGTIPLETAVAKLTSVPAARLGLRDRGLIQQGTFADLVVFDLATVRDEASYADPVRHPRGIEHVIVNGRPAILSRLETGERPGRLLRRT
jgi:N-acyl-D-aspartate/D-glutamate deacylase